MIPAFTPGTPRADPAGEWRSRTMVRQTPPGKSCGACYETCLTAPQWLVVEQSDPARKRSNNLKRPTFEAFIHGYPHAVECWWNGKRCSIGFAVAMMRLSIPSSRSHALRTQESGMRPRSIWTPLSIHRGSRCGRSRVADKRRQGERRSSKSCSRVPTFFTINRAEHMPDPRFYHRLFHWAFTISILTMQFSA